MEKQKYALITGATGGLGKAFVHEVVIEGYGLLLTGRSEEKLCRLKTEVEMEYPATEVRIYPADLSTADSRKEMMRKMVEEGVKISLLVNVAGADIQKGFVEYTEEKILFQCRVNFEAAVSLCRFAIEQKGDALGIINVSSVSGIYPMPYFAIYSATKGALTSFSQSLREEMKGRGVSVTAILPGAMPTREDIKEQIKGQGLWGKLAAKTPQAVAKEALKAVKKNKRKVVVGFWNKVMRIGTSWIPAPWRLKFIAKRWSKISKDAF
jgi:short-subunit dehydrogenase